MDADTPLRVYTCGCIGLPAGDTVLCFRSCEDGLTLFERPDLAGKPSEPAPQSLRYAVVLGVFDLVRDGHKLRKLKELLK